MLAILKAADTGQNFWMILAAAMVVFAVVQIIQDGFIVPRVMGHITALIRPSFCCLFQSGAR